MHTQTMFATAARRRYDCRNGCAKSLDGSWRFATYSACPAARPSWIYREDADLCFRHNLRARHIELQGYGQIQYTNTLYLWDGRSYLRPPQIDWDNTVGSYLREFDLTRGCAGSVCVSFQGAGAGTVRLVQRPLAGGYAEDSLPPRNLT